MTGNYQYTEDWFHWAPEIWERLVPLLPARSAFLEVGSYEGRSMVWTAENMAQGEAQIFCIDTWEGSEEHSAHDMAAVEARFDHNVKEVESRMAITIGKLKGKSTDRLAALAATYSGFFDFVYLDGSHIAPDVLVDACLAWSVLKPGGVMVLDDYLWGEPRDILHRPKLAIDAFINVFSERLEPVHMGYQVAIKKKGG